MSIDPSELEDRLDSLVATIDSHETVEEGPATTATNEKLTVCADISDVDYCQSVSALQDNIQTGDIYQVVPARSFSAPCKSAYAAYRHLRATNPSPYMFYMRGITPIACNSNKTYKLIGASSESNLKLDPSTREVQLYPITGTRPRGLNPDGSINHELDIRAELDIRTNVKEIAEHTMLVDLARNDLARVSLLTTRRVVELLPVNRYSRVIHLVSRVVATLDPEFDTIDAYRTYMNMGTLTGAPKLRAMEFLRGVEVKRRGSYGGSMDTCIVIRSAFIQDGVAVVQAGAGVLRDSIPQSEADETLHKAYAVLHAIALAAGKDLEVIH
ncbi:anthranilate synthase component 1 [Corynebacterium diphtheriae]|nr:anthranilate synthase component 1 [Corynebacterium diphtheriae]